MNANQHLQAGKKHDQGKTQPDLILRDMSQAILAVAEVATFGAGKYTAGGWLHVDDAINRYRNAKQRHMLASATEERDGESGLLHAAHEAWNALAVLELILRGAQAAPIDWDAAEKRMEEVGQNGNDGAVYPVAQIEGKNYTLPSWAAWLARNPDGSFFALENRPANDTGMRWQATTGRFTFVCHVDEHERRLPDLFRLCDDGIFRKVK